MSSTGRKKDLIWLSFEEIRNTSRKGLRAKCKHCGHEIEGQVKRMKDHLGKCIEIEKEDILDKTSK